MSKVLLSLIAVVASVLATFNVQAANYEIDPSHTYPYFEVSHLGFSTMRGRFNKTSGKFSMDKEKGTGSVEIEIDVASIDTAHEKRDKHLRSPDFFNAAEFPKIIFKSKAVKINGDSAVVEGDLTILGVTKAITLAVDKITCGVHPFNKKEMCGFNASGSLKRSDFGMKYGLPGIGDEIKIMIEAEGFKS